MPEYRVVWLQIADQQYRDQPDEVRALIDHRLRQLRRDPAGEPDAVYNRVSDQWSVVLGDQGLLFYAVVDQPATVIVLRLVSFS